MLVFRKILRTYSMDDPLPLIMLLNILNLFMVSANVVELNKILHKF